MKRSIYIVCLPLFLLGSLFAGEITTSDVEYTVNDVVHKGFIAAPAGNATGLAGVIVVHEWWGHNEHARSSAKKLAEMGYVAFAVDMYGEGMRAEHPDDAGKFAGAAMKNLAAAEGKFKAAMKLLQGHEATDPDKIAAIGYCFGGGVVLHMARSGVDLDGVVSFHGSLGSRVTAEPGSIKASILVCHGADDSFISDEAIAGFKQEMETAEADYKFVAYEGAVHSFTNPGADAFAEKFGMNVAYNEAADKASWQDMTKFFEKIFE